MSVCPLGHLPELKGHFSVFFCSYREGGPAVVSFPKLLGGRGCVGFVLMRRRSSCPGQRHVEDPLRAAYLQTSPGSLCSDSFVHRR